MKPEDKAKVQQALDALEWFKEHGLSVSEIELAENSITALRQLLEQPVQEPMFYWDMDGFFVRPERAKFLGLDVDAMQALYATPPAQPVDHGDELTIAYLDGVHTGKQIAKREWVGLTEEDKEQHRNDWHSNIHDKEFAAIEAKLREKNGGA